MTDDQINLIITEPTKAFTKPTSQPFILTSHIMMPKLKMSTFSSYLHPVIISGAIQ